MEPDKTYRGKEITERDVFGDVFYPLSSFYFSLNMTSHTVEIHQVTLIFNYNNFGKLKKAEKNINTYFNNLIDNNLKVLKSLGLTDFAKMLLQTILKHKHWAGDAETYSFFKNEHRSLL